MCRKFFGIFFSSPSGDPWFDDPKNIKSIRRGIAKMKAGKGRAYSIEELRALLNV